MTSTGTTTAGLVPVAPSRGVLRPLGLEAVRITGGFWADRQRINGAATLPHIRSWLDREGWIANLDLVVTGDLTGRRGRQFSDSEIFKYLEALAWEVGRTGSEELEAELRALVARIAAAQRTDGYVGTAFGHPGQAPRWSDLEWGHELYCIGHLLQAAVARERTRPGADDGLLGVATRAADLVCRTFGPGGIESVCGHAEIEPALVELGRVTGRSQYVEQARLFVERRGHHVLKDFEWGRGYYQDDVPIRDAETLHGHAVRANYLAAGAVDVADETGDRSLSQALARQWEHTVRRRTYVTGGQGSQHEDEGFGEDWLLPPDRAYSETCASIGSIMFSWRLLLDSGLPRYADLIERTLYNVVATSPAHDGRSFFYANTLLRRVAGTPSPVDEVSPRAGSSLRAPWFEVSCCPPNVARTLASLAGYLATATDDGVQLHQYAPCTVETELTVGHVRLEVTGDYPQSGVIRVEVLEAPATAWSLSLRVPSWVDTARLAVTSPAGQVVRHVGPGTVRLDEGLVAGAVVELDLPLRVRVGIGDPRIDAVRGTAVVERGPEVYCLESVDVPPDACFADLYLDPASVRDTGEGRLVARLVELRVPERDWPYGPPAVAPSDRELAAPLVRYHDWANRGPSAMRVWIPLTRAPERG